MADGQFDIPNVALSEAEAPGADHWGLIRDTENNYALTLIWGDPIESYVVGAVGGALTEITPPQLLADADNWNPTNMNSANVVRMSSDAARNITGIDAGSVSPSALLKKLINVGAYNITLKDQDAGSDPDNQFLLAGGTGDIILQPGDAIDVYYDATDEKWRSA